MAQRYVYKVLGKYPYIRKVLVEFNWYSGFALAQKRRCIESLHTAYGVRYPHDRVLEISSKSPDDLGVALSAFDLTLEIDNVAVPVECAFQAGKVFEEGGPFTDLLGASPRNAKRDARLRESGGLVAFEFQGKRYPLRPKNAFYNWLWISAVAQHDGLSKRVLPYDAFTDIEFNPQKSINCQAIAAALYVGLVRDGKIDIALNGFEEFVRVAY